MIIFYNAKYSLILKLDVEKVINWLLNFANL